MGITTISGIIKEICTTIWQVLKEECLTLPHEWNEWFEIAKGFEKNTNFPQCVGAIDGKHVRVIMPYHSSSLFFNYKGFFSVVLIAMCDANYCFRYVNIGAPGKNSDSGIFRESELFKKIEQDALNLPPSKLLPGNSSPVPYVFLADDAFGLSKNIMIPYARKNLTYKKKIFNYRHCRARRMIECTFGILTNKFRLFHRPMNIDIDLVNDVIKCCCILHNFIRIREGYAAEHTLVIHGLRDIESSELERNARGNQIRDRFANYFITEDGRVEWQDYYIT